MKGGAHHVALLLLMATLRTPNSHAFVITQQQELKTRTDYQVRLWVSPSLSNMDHSHHPNVIPQEGLTTPQVPDVSPKLSPLECSIRTATLITFIFSMCIVMPTLLVPVWILQQCNWMERPARETLALDVGQTCARVLWRILPFCELHVDSDATSDQPKIWVCNHTSMLDTFVLLAADKRIRGRNKRPIKTVYWKGLEDNPVCNMLFQLCGFIPVDMEANGSGNPNQYNKASFLHLMKQVKKAFDEGFDILILPEGQLNPNPEQGVLPVFTGAHKLSRLSRRPVNLFALYACHEAWPAEQTLPCVQTRDLYVRGYDGARQFASDEEFIETFRQVVGQFGATGSDTNELDQWLDGSAWGRIQYNSESENETSDATNTSLDATNTGDIEQAIADVLKREQQSGVDADQWTRI
mmetsp:Transcript_9182/g.17477  ORF Transcript_9182/g.17477 Transcript_9182/m.17477 type:complete len:410 (-) Transcript_9182:111-1340(-)